MDATAKTITITHHKKDTVVTIAPDAKIYKIGEKGKNGATGTFTDLTVGTLVNVHTNGDETTPTATEVHLRAPKGTAPAATPATAITLCRGGACPRPYFSAPTASNISARETVATPTFFTAAAPAQFASVTASAGLAPAASANVSVEITVSPAPATSYTATG